MRLNAKFFYNFISNRIILAEFTPIQYNYQNVNQFQTHGLNARLRYDFSNRVSVQSGFAYTRLFNRWSEENQVQTFTPLPEWQNELNVLIPFIETRFVLTHRYIGKQINFFIDDEEQIAQGFVGAYHFMNASLSRSFWQKRLFVSIGSKNLLNTQTVPFLGSGSGAHSSAGDSQLLNWGRTYFVRMNLKIGKL